MIRKTLQNIMLLLAAVCSSATAQVTVKAELDEPQMLVGEQRKLTLSVDCDSALMPSFPQWQPEQPLADGVELVEFIERKATALDGGRNHRVSICWTVTAFDSVLAYIPPIPVYIGDSAYESNALALKVITLDVDTLHPEVFAPAKSVSDLPFSYQDDYISILGIPLVCIPLIAIMLIMIAAFIALRYYQHKPIIRIVRRIVKRPPHQVAMDDLSRIKAEKSWAAEDSKEYYTQLTDTIRRYIKERFGFNATEMTSGEIITHLTESGDQQALDELRQLFETADLVKFAKYTTLINENDMNLVNAVAFVNQTKQVVDPATLVVEDETAKEENRQERKRSLSMLVAVVVISLAAAALLILVGFTLYDLR
ncbi:MAG: hypothetical protein J5486_05140 [Bacteroidaceae bacterium]|nr:hypothetical protein [Bacteroidaceae bacterium]